MNTSEKTLFLKANKPFQLNKEMSGIEPKELSKNKFFFPYSIHLTLWVIYELFLYYINVVRGNLSTEVYLGITAFSTVIKPLLFYTYFLYLVPKFLEKNKIAIFSIITLSILLTIPFVIIEYTSFAKTWFDELPSILEVNRVSRHLWISFNLTVFIALATGARFANDWYKNQKIKKELESQNKLSEIALLRSQINPHFLFNTLNNIYSLTYKKDDNAPTAVLKLSELMRYMLNEASTDKVFLDQEITYIQNYIDLQKLRLKTENSVYFDIKGDYFGKKISPMLLIPFIENAFKHGTSPQKLSQLFFQLEVKGDNLYFHSENDMVNPQLANQTEDEKGIGQKNVLRRLILLYPEKHKIDIKTVDNKYIVDLEIKL